WTVYPKTDANFPNWYLDATSSSGIFFAGSEMRLFNIDDGASNTAGLSEHRHGQPTLDPGTSPKTADDVPALSLVGAYTYCAAADPTTKTTPEPVGTPWLRGYHSTTLYTHV